MCEMHRKRWRKHGDPSTVKRQRTWAGASCSVTGCDRPVKGHGLCSPHWQRHRKFGDAQANVPLGVWLRGMSLYDRVMARSVVADNGCRIFIGAHNAKGYGKLHEAGRSYYAHRIVLEYHHGPSDMPALHECDNPPCVNIDHLRYSTPADNTADMMRRGRAWWQKV